ncbi:MULTISPECIES: hypothetical protein [unclassified Nocardia]|uniref:hypothetical protein n=1 Tax=unclassified Nocardia TaxID=2637762 RepID=UPI00278C1D29|nr:MULTISPECIES: hypothetical protein [unclassified Nocardia]
MTDGGTRFGGLKSQAENGGGQLLFDASVVADMVNACNGVLGQLLALRTFADQVSTLAAFAGPPELFESGTHLARAYSSAGADLAAYFETHITTLDDLVATYKAAGKAFAGAEDESVRAFESIQRPLGGSFTTPHPALGGGGEVPAFEPKEPAATSPSGANAISAENPESKSWEDLYQLRESIDAPAVAYIGSVWGFIATELSGAVPELSTKIVGSNDKWAGGSGDTARSAASSYADNLVAFVASIKTIGEGLGRISGWLQACKNSMPTEQRNPAYSTSSGQQGLAVPAEAVPDRTNEFRENYRRTYVAGIADYNTATPKLHPPTNPVNPATVPQSPTGADTSPVTDGGSPAQQTPTAPTTEVDPQDPQQPEDQAPEPSPATDTPAPSTEDPAQQLTQLAQGALQMAGQVAQQVAQTVQQAIQSVQEQIQQLDDRSDEEDQLEEPQLAQDDPANGTPESAVPTGSGGGPSATPQTTLSDTPTSNLYPRANIAEEVSTARTAGTPSSNSPYAAPGMMPMGAAGAAGAGQSQEKEYKRASFLEDRSHLAEALGELPTAVKPVADT